MHGISPGIQGWRAALTAIAVATAVACGPVTEYDLVLRNGTVVDGTGLDRFEGDVAITDGRIAAVGDLGRFTATEEVDVTGLFVAPGFVNLHSHDRLRSIATAENLLTQGVTTIILNADGGGPLDVASQLSGAQAGGLAVNVGANVGFNTAWAAVNGPADARPTPGQLGEMRSLVVQGLRDGAWGVSAGLDYKPTYFASVDEVSEVLSGLGPWRTVFTNHDRLTPESGFSSMLGMQETVAIGEASGLTPIITHMKIQGREQGSSTAVLAMMDEATAGGTYTAADAYPYLAGQTSLAALIIPGWAQAGGREAMVARFDDRSLRARIVTEADEALAARFGGAAGVFLPESQRELTDVMAEMGVTSGGEAVVRLLQDETPGAILRFGSEEDLRAILTYPSTSIACDCDATVSPTGHPRAWGTFPRVLGRFVREGGWMSWETAIEKMTSLPATTIGMVDRGLVAPGMVADITVFDPETVIDAADYMSPTTPSAGIVHVLIGGRWALRDGAATGAGAGEALVRAEHEAARRPSTAVSRAVRADLVFGNESVLPEVAEVRVDVSQGAGERGAEGTVDFLDDGGEPVLSAVRLGVLQVAEGWATLGMTVRDRDGVIMPLTLTIDLKAPSAEADVTLVSVGASNVAAGPAGSTGAITISRTR